MLQPKKKTNEMPAVSKNFMANSVAKPAWENKKLQKYIIAENENQAIDKAELNRTGSIASPKSAFNKQVASNFEGKKTVLSKQTRSIEEMARVARSITAAKSDSKHAAKPLIYLDNPDKLIGDALGAVAPNNKLGFPNSKKEREDLAYNTHNPYKSQSEKINYSFKKGLEHVPGAVANLALAGEGAGVSGVLRTLNNSVNPLAGSGGAIKRVGSAITRSSFGLMTPTRTNQLMSKIGAGAATGLAKDNGKESVIESGKGYVKRLFGIKSPEEKLRSDFYKMNDKLDNSLESSTAEFEKQKQQSLDFWATPEGRKRIQGNLDENDVYTTPNEYIQKMQDISVVKDVRAIRKAGSDAVDEIPRLTEEKKALVKRRKSGEITEQEADKHYEDKIEPRDRSVFDRILKANRVPKNNASYSKYADNNEKIFIGEDYSVPAQRGQTVAHEWGHAKDKEGIYTANVRNKQLIDDLDLHEDIPDHLTNKTDFDSFRKSMRPENNSKDAINNLSTKERRGNYFNGAKKYFLEGNGDGPSEEPIAFLSEVRHHLMETGAMKNLGDPITDDMIKQSMETYKKDQGMKTSIRLFDIASPTERTIQGMKKHLNKLQGVIPLALTTGAGYAVKRKSGKNN